jgi:hypothetical protein
LIPAQKKQLVFLLHSGNVIFGHRAGGGAQVELIARLGRSEPGYFLHSEIAN